jgi:anti-sigma regulatory factor (Ser/Thr protein kinase)
VIEAEQFNTGTGTRSQTIPGLQLSLRRSVQAPGDARAALNALCDELGVERSRRHTLVLLVSEVVSNAVLHSNGPYDADIEISADVGEATIRITVTDAGEGFVPSERDPAREDGGYGLYLLERAASSWGVEVGAATSVWFDLPIDA